MKDQINKGRKSFAYLIKLYIIFGENVIKVNNTGESGFTKEINLVKVQKP